jgi:hypothetical protein
MSYKAPFFIGCRRELVPNWQEIVPELKVASNLKDPVKIAEAQDKARKTLSKMPLTSRIVDVSILDRDGRELLLANADGIQSDMAVVRAPELVAVPGVAMMVAIAELLPNGIEVDDFNRITLFGFDIHENLRIGALDVALFGIGKTPNSVQSRHWKTSQFSDKPGVVDPYHYLLTSDQRTQIKLPVLLQQLGCKSVDPENDTLLLSRELSHGAYALAKATNLY